MVLTYYHQWGNSCGDNINEKLTTCNKRPDLKPVYSFKCNWIMASSNKGEKTNWCKIILNLGKDLMSRF